MKHIYPNNNSQGFCHYERVELVVRHRFSGKWTSNSALCQDIHDIKPRKFLWWELKPQIIHHSNEKEMREVLYQMAGKAKGEVNEEFQAELVVHGLEKFHYHEAQVGDCVAIDKKSKVVWKNGAWV